MKLNFLPFFSSKKTILSTLLISFFSATSYAVCPPAGSGVVASGGASDTGCTITTAANNTPGLLAQNFVGIYTLDNSSINTSGLGSEGVRVSNAAVTLNNVSITTSGNSNGMFINLGGQVIMNGGSITVGGASAFGMQVMGTNSTAELNNAIVNVAASPGSTATGLLANNTGGAGGGRGGGSTINVTGLNATGVFANGLGSQINLNQTAVFANSTGSSGSGARALGGSVLNISNGSSITTTGDAVYGVFLDQGSTGTINDTNISTAGNFSFGTYVQEGSTLTLGNVDVSTTGINGTGLNAINNATATVTNTLIHTTGVAGFGVVIINGLLGGSTVNFSNSSVETTGADAYAIVLSTSTGGAGTNFLTATNTQFSAANATLIIADNGTGIINFNTVLAHAAPSQDFLLVDTGANLNFAASNSSLSGDVHTNAGGFSNLVFLNNTDFTGAIQPANIVTTGATSTWNLTGNSTISQQLFNAGTINFVPEGNNFKTLTATDYIGQNGTMGMNTFLGADGSPSDLLLIDSGAATGNTTLNIHNTTGQGALTLSDGILVVQALNGATTAPGAFALNSANDVTAGPYVYTLQRGGVNGNEPENWFLRSTMRIPNPPGPPGPGPTPSPFGPVIHIPGLQPGYVPNYRPIVSLYSAIPSLGLLYNQLLFDTLHQRVGEEEDILNEPGMPMWPVVNGAWVRVIGNEGERNNGTIFDNGPDFTYHTGAFETGIDIYHQRHANGSSDFVGPFAAFGGNHGNIENVFGRSAGDIDYNSNTGGIYWTHFGARPWYVDVIGEGTYDHVNAVNGTTNIFGNYFAPYDFHTHGSNWGGSVESGYAFPLGNDVTFEPQAQLSYQTLSLNGKQGARVKVDFDDANSTVGRIGARFTKTWPDLDLRFAHIVTGWVTVNAVHDFSGNSTTLFSSAVGFVPIGSTVKGSWADIGVGISNQITKNTALFATYDRQQLFSNNTGFANEGRLGVRVNF